MSCAEVASFLTAMTMLAMLVVIAHKSLHCLVLRHAQFIVSVCRFFGTVFGSNPESLHRHPGKQGGLFVIDV